MRRVTDRFCQICFLSGPAALSPFTVQYSCRVYSCITETLRGIKKSCLFILLKMWTKVPDSRQVQKVQTSHVYTYVKFMQLFPPSFADMIHWGSKIGSTKSDLENFYVRMQFKFPFGPLSLKEATATIALSKIVYPNAHVTDGHTSLEGKVYFDDNILTITPCNHVAFETEKSFSHTSSYLPRLINAENLK
jgi:hypothetical protein